MTALDRVERFHLLFLRTFFPELGDRLLVTLKGGVNLRLFFGSPRYSEDLDLDVRVIATHTLARKVEGVLDGRSFQRVLAASGLELTSWSAPKQTHDVQRWKLMIAETGGRPEPAKIEFSRRKQAAAGIPAAIPSAILDRQGIVGPVIVTHYGADEAARQKVEALLHRAEPQARDVFDLNLLLARKAALPELSVKEREAARERVLQFSLDDFRGQVVAWLDADERSRYATRETIEALQMRVAEALG